jgi:Trk-type K+ transport system membrane component
MVQSIGQIHLKLTFSVLFWHHKMNDVGDLKEKIWDWMIIGVSISAMGSLILFHGFPIDTAYYEAFLWYLHFCFAFYLVMLVRRSILSEDWKAHVREHIVIYSFYALLYIGILLRSTTGFAPDRWLLSFTGISNQELIYILFLDIWLLLMAGNELGRMAFTKYLWRLSPPFLFSLSFIVLIGIGSILFMLPEMTANGLGMHPLDALFTSVSANCVTGLIVVDTATYFSTKGKVLLMVFIQLGGLNIIAFATFFISRFHKLTKGSESDQKVREIMGTSSLESGDMLRFLRDITITSLIIEAIGAYFLFHSWDAPGIEVFSEQVLMAVFHSVSAFNNAGFSLFTGGLTHESIADNFTWQYILCGLIFIGGLGYAVIWDLFTWPTGTNLIKYHTFLGPGTRIALWSSLVLIVLGSGVFFLWEHNGVLNGASTEKQWAASIFQSITARTAGFHTVPIKDLSMTSLTLLMFLMFVGASSGSTGGGIKTSTLAVLVTNPWLNHTKAILDKAATIAIYSAVVIGVSSFLLMISQPEMSPAKLSFEAVSAFATCGLSTGITPELNSFSRVILMITMFIGRVGPLSLAYSLIIHHKTHPETGFMIG